MSTIQLVVIVIAVIVLVPMLQGKICTRLLSRGRHRVSRTTTGFASPDALRVTLARADAADEIAQLVASGNAVILSPGAEVSVIGRRIVRGVCYAQIMYQGTWWILADALDAKKHGDVTTAMPE